MTTKHTEQSAAITQAQKAAMKCYICQSTTEELRPYGKNGQPICFDCMMGSNETQAEAKRQFGAALDGAAQHSEMVLIGKETGPEPVGGNRH